MPMAVKRRMRWKVSKRQQRLHSELRKFVYFYEGLNVDQLTLKCHKSVASSHRCQSTACCLLTVAFSLIHSVYHAVGTVLMNSAFGPSSCVFGGVEIPCIAASAALFQLFS